MPPFDCPLCGDAAICCGCCAWLDDPATPTAPPDPHTAGQRRVTQEESTDE